MSDSVISGSGFHGARGDSVHTGDLFEALTKACAELAFPASENWRVVHQYTPQYSDADVPDVFDLGIFRVTNGSQTADRALVLEVTHWKDEESVSEEPNKSYKAIETLEEFSFLGSRTRVPDSTVRGLPQDTAFGDVIFGNRRYVRKWIPTQYELFLDFVSYPSYEYLDSEPTDPDTGIKQALLEAYEPFDDIVKFVTWLKNRLQNNSNSEIIDIVGGRLLERFEQFKQDGFPLSPLGSAEYRARHDYRDTDEYRKNMDFLDNQITSGGLPADRFGLKAAWTKIGTGDADVEQFDQEWQPLLRAVLNKTAEEIPEVEAGREIVDNAESVLPQIRDLCESGDIDDLAEYWNHPEETQRIAYRNALRALYQRPVDDFYEELGVTEQNFSSEVFDPSVTQCILEQIADQIALNASGSSTSEWVRTGRQLIERSVDYQAVNGTNSTPTNWTLSHLIEESSLQFGDQVDTRGRWYSYIKDVPYDEFVDRLITFRDAEDMWRPTFARAEFSFENGDSAVYIKSKPTRNEEGRRAREEGGKGWFGKLNLPVENDHIEPEYSDDEWWMWVDGEWGHRDNLERLVECGWRVYLDPFTLVEDLESI